MTKKTDWYLDFVNQNFTPSSNSDLVCLFRVCPAKGISNKEAAGRIASESSTGTWTTLAKMPKRMNELKATAYEISDEWIKVAYPLELWEKNNLPQLLSGIAGNIFGMKALKSLRLEDVYIPSRYLNGFQGPQHGIDGIRDLLKVKDRPITGAVVKPKIGFSSQEHAKVGFETWVGGFDLIKDDENLTSTSFNKFEDRVKLCSKMRDKAEKETGSKKSALINITGETEVMKKRAKLLADAGFEFVMVDAVTVGMAALQTIRQLCGDLGIAIHAHRAMHAVFDRNPKHGISMLALAKLLRLLGVDQLHIGTVVGKMSGKKQEVLRIQQEITNKKISENISNGSIPLLKQDWKKIKPVLPVASGGLHPGLIPEVMNIMGNDIALLISGGIHGHPNGTRQGAAACMQAIEGYMNGTSLKLHAESNAELGLALKKWGFSKPR